MADVSKPDGFVPREQALSVDGFRESMGAFQVMNRDRILFLEVVSRHRFRDEIFTKILWE